MSQKRLVADILFWLQVSCILVFGFSQFVRLLTSATGVNVSWFALGGAFFLFNLVLAVHAHKNRPSRVTIQTVFAYSLGLLAYLADLGAMIAKSTGTWDRNDTITSIIVLAGVVLALCIGLLKNLGFADPMVRGWLAVLFKGVPQLTLAYKIFSIGGAGLAGLTIVVGHILVLSRLGQLAFSIREANWDRNRLGSALSEVANEASWIVVTFAWLLR